MKRPVITATVSAMFLLLGGMIFDAPLVGVQEAQAQDWIGNRLETQQNMRQYKHNQQRARQHRATKKQGGTQQNLTARQRACAKRYRTYNPRTDRYVARPGVTRRCAL